MLLLKAVIGPTQALGAGRTRPISPVGTGDGVGRGDGVCGKVTLQKSIWDGGYSGTHLWTIWSTTPSLAKIFQEPHNDSVPLASCQKHSEKQSILLRTKYMSDS